MILLHSNFYQKHNAESREAPIFGTPIVHRELTVHFILLYVTILIFSLRFISDLFPVVPWFSMAVPL